MATFVDAEESVRSWINSLTSTLVGEGKPLTKGAHLHELRGAANVCYAQLQLTGGSAALGAENSDHRATISALIYGPTREAAALAAVAYAEAVNGLDGRSTAAGSATCLVADNISGPAYAPDGALPRYLVSAEFYLRAA